MKTEELFHKIYGILIEKDSSRHSYITSEIRGCMTRLKKKKDYGKMVSEERICLLNIEYYKNVMRQIFGKINL